MVDHVLSRFSVRERETLEAVVRLAADAVTLWVTNGLEACMNSFNSVAQEPDRGPEV
jgi:peptidyl-tRNA hydrolase